MYENKRYLPYCFNYLKCSVVFILKNNENKYVFIIINDIKFNF